MAVLLEIMCGVDQIDQILLGAEMGINAKVIVNVIAVVGICVVFEHRGEPDSCAAQTGDIVKILGDASYIASEEGIGCDNARRAHGTARDRARDVVLEPIDHEEVDELFAPLAVNIEVLLAGNRFEIEFFD